jgi:hypothetical protein
MHRRSWFAAFLVLGILLLANLICWSLGVGSGLKLPGNPPGTELELFFGFPSQYRAELWRSNEPALADRILKLAPFYLPGKEMVRQVRYTGASAIAVDFLFALLLAGLAAITAKNHLVADWPRRDRQAVWALLLGLSLLFVVAGRVSVHL